MSARLLSSPLRITAFVRVIAVFGLLLMIFSMTVPGLPAMAQDNVTPDVTPDELEDLPFFLSFIPNIQFAPLYVTAAKGYFVEQGFNVLIEHGDENVGVEQIAVGTVPVGIISGEQVILARANQRPVVYVYEWFNEYPVAAVIASTVPATTFAELAGYRVGIPGFYGANYTGLTALLNSGDMTENDIRIESIGFNAPDVLCLGAVDAAVVYINNEPLQIQHRIDAGTCGDVNGITVIPVSDNVNLVSNGIVTNEKILAERPELVHGVVRAFDAGLRDAINNPAEAYLLSADYVDGLPMSDALFDVLTEQAEVQAEFLKSQPDREAIAASRDTLLETVREAVPPDDRLQFEVLMETVLLWDDETLGLSDNAAWEATQDILIQIGSIDTPIDLDLAYTSDFVPQPEAETENDDHDHHDGDDHADADNESSDQ